MIAPAIATPTACWTSRTTIADRRRLARPAMKSATPQHAEAVRASPTASRAI
jgi:hypothetical protein